MKKLLYLFVFIIVTSLSISACTEEEVKPQAENVTGGGGPIKE
jgi:uncharacterized lipoprotein YehR (DUF1307 family)